MLKQSQFLLSVQIYLWHPKLDYMEHEYPVLIYSQSGVLSRWQRITYQGEWNGQFETACYNIG